MEKNDFFSSLVRAPPFLIFYYHQKGVPDQIIELNETSYELVSALYNTGGHFIAYARFPEVNPVKAGLYRYNDMDGIAARVNGNESKRNPVMLIYRAIQQRDT